MSADERRITASEAEEPGWAMRLWIRVIDWISKDLPGRRYKGILILVDDPNDEYPTDILFQRVENAMDLIRFHDNWADCALKRFVRFVEVRSIRPLHAGWSPVERSVKLDSKFVHSTSAVLLASMIVHELTHARVWFAGIPYSNELDGRLEELSTRRSVAFARRAGATGEEIEKLEASTYDPTDSELIERNQEWLVDSGTPKWLVGPLARVQIWATRRTRRRT